MAAADYRLCDVCINKVFYDSNLNYDYDGLGWVKFDEIDKQRGYSLDYLGDWICICKECSKTWEVVVQKKGDIDG